MTTWWMEPVRVDLTEIMDDLDPGWSAWRDVPDSNPAEIG